MSRPWSFLEMIVHTLPAFHRNPQIGKDRRLLTAETRKRTKNGLDCEDQEARDYYLREARGWLN